MKRIISILLVIAITLSNSIMTIAETSKGSTKIDSRKAIEIAKQSFDLDTEGCDFNQNYSESQDNQKQWNLNWNSRTTEEHISVSVDADTGDIISMNHWKSAYATPSKLSKYRREEAKKIAEETIKRLQPREYKEMKLLEPVGDNSYDYDNYNFQYIRQINDIPFQGNGINIGIDKNTLELKHYNFTWHKGQVPSSLKAISLEEGKEVFNEKNGLELSYIISYDNKTKENKAILVYNLKNGNRPIDAITKEPINQGFYGDAEDMAAGSSMAFAEERGANLTPEEIKRIEDIANYLSKEDALKIGEKYALINKNQKLSHASLFSYDNGKNATWNLSWDYNDPKAKEYAYSSISINAITGEVLSFYKNDSKLDKSSKEKPIYNKDQSMALAEEFLNEIASEKFKQTNHEADEYRSNNLEDIKSYQFKFTREANEIPCKDNYLRVTINAHTGDITNYYNNWDDIEFIKPENILSIEEAYKALYENIDFKLQYIIHYDYELKSPNNKTVKLVYAFENFSGMLDPKLGSILDYNGKIIEEKDITHFNDIEGHWAEKDILALVESGIIEIDSEKFNPDTAIKQKEFIRILVNSVQPYYPIIPLREDEEEIDKEYEEFYKQAIARKIIKKDEKDMNANVNRIETAKMVINALELGYVANKSEIFNLDYKDSDKIPKDLKGYGALSTGLDIMTGTNGYFLPEKELTKAEAASMIVKFLELEQ